MYRFSKIIKFKRTGNFFELLIIMLFCTFRLLNEAGKPIYGFSFKKELRNSNPFSPSLKDRTKRIAKELASIHTSLPLNASNSIFICMDESRCDMLKVLISGPGKIHIEI